MKNAIVLALTLSATVAFGRGAAIETSADRAERAQTAARVQEVCNTLTHHGRNSSGQVAVVVEHNGAYSVREANASTLQSIRTNARNIAWVGVCTVDGGLRALYNGAEAAVIAVRDFFSNPTENPFMNETYGRK